MTEEQQRIAIAEACGWERANMTRFKHFMQKVTKQIEITSPYVSTPCWLWGGSVSGSGYGRFWNGTRTIQAHWFLKVDFVPIGKEACHHCDNKLCVNPEHIFISDRCGNMQDMVRKNRHNPEAKAAACRNMLKTRRVWRGSDNHASKLIESDVMMVKGIKPAYGLGRVMAMELGVSETVISGIWKGKRWVHIQPDATARQRAEAFLKAKNLWTE